MNKCSKCGGSTITISKDSRGVASAFCKDCGHFIKKMSTNEVVDYYEDLLKQKPSLEDMIDVNATLNAIEAIKEETEKEREEREEKPMCKYCTEHYAIMSSRVNIRPVRIDAKYCPMCGRKLKATDRDY